MFKQTLFPRLFVAAFLAVSVCMAGHINTALAAESDKWPILTPKPGAQPKINGPTVYGCRPGRAFIYRIPCTGDRPMKFAAKGLPYGLGVDQNTGIITGTILAPPGDYVLTLSATNASGSDEKQLRLAVGDTLALTPPMGWNSWYTYYYAITQDEMYKQTDAMVSSGMADFGYQYVSLDDCWMKLMRDPPHRDERGIILPSKHFPDMRKLTDYIHAYGLKAGTYVQIGPGEMHVGAYQHLEDDVKQFAAWGFDFLKLDTCSALSENLIMSCGQGDEALGQLDDFSWQPQIADKG